MFVLNIRAFLLLEKLMLARYFRQSWLRMQGILLNTAQTVVEICSNSVKTGASFNVKNMI